MQIAAPQVIPLEATLMTDIKVEAVAVILTHVEKAAQKMRNILEVTHAPVVALQMILLYHLSIMIILHLLVLMVAAKCAS